MAGRLVSVIVCTYNRRDSLRKTLAALEALQTVGFEQEWIVVDNNSTDGTAAFLADYASRQPRLRVLREEKPGKSHALNTALAVARGDILAFTDDDVRPAPDWLVRLVAAYDRHGAAIVGGPVLLEANTPLPAWIHPRLVPLLGLKDVRPQVYEVRPPDALAGANMSIRRDVLERVGPFNPDLGPRSTPGGRAFAVAYSEDNDLCYRVSRLEGMGQVLYDPQVITYHAMMPEKLTRRYFHQRAYGEGQAIVLLTPVDGGRGRRQRWARALRFTVFGAAGWLKHWREPDERLLREFLLIREWTVFKAQW